MTRRTADVADSDDHPIQHESMVTSDMKNPGTRLDSRLLDFSQRAPGVPQIFLVCLSEYMSVAAGMNDSEILAHISGLPHAQANFRQLVRELGTRGPPARNWSRPSRGSP